MAALPPDVLQQLVCQSPGMMAHPGLPAIWVALVLGAMLAVVVWLFRQPRRAGQPAGGPSLAAWPIVGPWLRQAVRRPGLLVGLRLFTAAVFLLVIYAGLFGTPFPARNVATVLTWSLWWTGLIISVYFVGSAWCAICPWDALATWLVRRRLWGRGPATASLNLRVPRAIRNVWPAWWMFIALTWLELGLGITASPYLTAILALVILVLATLSLAVFERKAFCRYFCSVGRTLGVYSQLAPIALRPIDPAICARCRTLECYHGTDTVEPCPTHLVMGRLRENTYCTSCGACSQSCPEQNVAWSTRPTGEEAMHTARPSWDGAWFILGLVALTSFHGLTMLPFWEPWMRSLGRLIGDSGQLLGSFTIGMAGSLAVPAALFALAVWATWRSLGRAWPYRRLFAQLALAGLPLAFAYHLAHNVNHLVREGQGAGSVLRNPLGIGAQPLSEAEMQLRHLQPLLHQEVLFALQAGLLIFGFWLAVRILRQRLLRIAGEGNLHTRHLIPMLLFIVAVTLFNLWLLMQPMIMRM